MLLEIKDLRVGFDVDGGHVYAVDGISFFMNGGGVGIIGESGCGKSVTCKAILQLNVGAVQSGSILFDGKDVLTLDEDELKCIRGKEVALIPQNTSSALNPAVTIGKQIMEVIQLHRGLSNMASYGASIRLLNELNIPDAERKLNEYPFQQSLGINQRVLIAIALSCNPKLIIADEPTASLDATIQKQILGILKEIKKEKALLIVSHDLAAIREVTDRTIVMYRGRIMEEGDTEEVFERPLHPYTKALIASSPYGKEDIVLKGEQPSSMIETIGCPFAGRCPQVIGEICHTTAPLLSKMQHNVFCHAYSKL